MKKRKGYRAGTSSVRQDYREGGRVQANEGGYQTYEQWLSEYQKDNPAPKPIRGNYKNLDAYNAKLPGLYSESVGVANSELNRKYREALKKLETQSSNTSSTTEDNTKMATNNAKDRAENIISGNVKPEPIEPIAEQNQYITGTKTPIVPTVAGMGQNTITNLPVEQAGAVADSAQTSAVPTMTPATIDDVSLVSTTPIAEAATGVVSDEAIADTLQVEKIPTTQTATVEIPTGALTERITGTLSPAALSNATKVAGVDLRRVSRAKTQLETAGISSQTISNLGNDPQALENALMDVSEEERGLIEGLPKEALVSTQMDSLLTGIESGEIPTWARPAVSSVEQMLAERGLEASTVGRDNLFNAIIQSALPIAQSNAQAIQTSINQERSIEAQINIKEAEFSQQTALQNANNVFQLDMAQFSADQQTALSNSKFLQTVGLTDASAKQQGIIQDTALLSQANLAEANYNTQLSIQNAKSFLAMDMTNLSNEQQIITLNAQAEQQRLLSNQAVENAAKQFNATSQNQVNQFTANLNAQISQANIAQQNATNQFNVAAQNAANARNTQIASDIAKENAKLKQEADKYNVELSFQREQFNANNAAQVEAANVQWRRQANTAATAAQNAVNMQNAQNAFNLTASANAFLWQEFRDQADFAFREAENAENRTSQIISTALSADPGKYANSVDSLKNLVNSIIGSAGTETNIVPDYGIGGTAGYS
tara:strand:+ start:171 stop:2321 length:2151 start_codon:yes stop_codon:yes gene_type:complete